MRFVLLFLLINPVGKKEKTLHTIKLQLRYNSNRNALIFQLIPTSTTCNLFIICKTPTKNDMKVNWMQKQQPEKLDQPKVLGIVFKIFLQFSKATHTHFVEMSCK